MEGHRFARPSRGGGLIPRATAGLDRWLSRQNPAYRPALPKAPHHTDGVLLALFIVQVPHHTVSLATEFKAQKTPQAKAWGAVLCQKATENYSATSVTTPEPTVRPPSRIAKRRPFSIAMGVISSTFITTLSPGMHISTPSGREMMPVTSVVRK